MIALNKEFSSALLPLIWNPLYLIISEAMKSKLEYGQLKFYKIWNKKVSGKKRKASVKRGRVFLIALKGGEGGSVESLLRGILNIQCFCHAEDNIQ